jgi:hypothetical protein
MSVVSEASGDMGGSGRQEGGTEPPAVVRQSDKHVIGCFVLLVVGLYLTIGPALQLSQWRVPKELNPCFLEALSWAEGRVALPEKGTDAALYNGKWYNVYPPLFTLVSFAATQLGKALGQPADEFYSPWYVLVVALPLPVAGFWAFQQVLRKAEWSAVLTAYWLLGTPMHPQLIACRGGTINPIDHMFANIGLMLIAGDLLGRRRMWVAAIGFVVAIWSRQNLVLLAPAALAAAWMTSQRWRSLAVVAAALMVSVGTLMALNWVKFDSPFDTGYRYIYVYRPDGWLGRRALTYGLFSHRFIPEKAWSMNLAPPRFRLTREGLVPENTEEGVAIWMTSPLLLGGFIGLRRWWKDKTARALMLSSLLVIGSFLAYHARGATTAGYFTYALDFLPVWLVVIAPWAARRWRRWFTLACLAYSAVYFHLLSQAYP